MLFPWIVVLLLIGCQDSAGFSNLKSCTSLKYRKVLNNNYNNKRQPFRVVSLNSYEESKVENSFSNSEDVKYVLSKIFETIQPVASKNINLETRNIEELSLVDVENKFNQILSDIKSSTSLTEMEKRFLSTETSLTLIDTQEMDDNFQLFAIKPQQCSRPLQQKS